MTGQVQILLVEDNPLDVRATLRAAQDLTVDHAIEVVTDGEAAIARLTDLSHRPPDFVLLDLDLPGRTGHDVLEVIKDSPRLRSVPVVVLTTSDDESDVARAYELGANAFVTKPGTFEAWQAMLTRLESFWFSVVELPPT